MRLIAILLMVALLIGSASSATYQLGNTYVNGALNVKNATALNVTTATTVTVAGAAKGEQITSTDDLLAYDTATVNALVVNATATITGKLATGLAPTYTHQDWSGNLSQSSNADKTIYLVGNASSNQTIILDAVATAAGKSYTFLTVTDPGNHYFILDGTGAETINGGVNVASTARYESVTVYCDGIAWYILNKIGTWGAVVP
jgi:cell wall-associated NlpC family hydrolase